MDATVAQGERPPVEGEANGMAESREHDNDDEGPDFGSKVCRCPKCGLIVPHKERGRPCSSRKCPECGSNMKGEQCQG